MEVVRVVYRFSLGIQTHARDVVYIRGLIVEGKLERNQDGEGTILKSLSRLGHVVVLCHTP